MGRRGVGGGREMEGVGGVGWGGGGGGRSSKFNSFKLSSSHVYNTAHPLNPPSQHFLFFSPSSVKHRDLVLGSHVSANRQILC